MNVCLAMMLTDLTQALKRLLGFIYEEKTNLFKDDLTHSHTLTLQLMIWTSLINMRERKNKISFTWHKAKALWNNYTTGGSRSTFLVSRRHCSRIPEFINTQRNRFTCEKWHPVTTSVTFSSSYSILYQRHWWILKAVDSFFFYDCSPDPWISSVNIVRGDSLCCLTNKMCRIVDVVNVLVHL